MSGHDYGYQVEAFSIIDAKFWQVTAELLTPRKPLNHPTTPSDLLGIKEYRPSRYDRKCEYTHAQNINPPRNRLSL